MGDGGGERGGLDGLGQVHLETGGQGADAVFLAGRTQGRKRGHHWLCLNPRSLAAPGAWHLRISGTFLKQAQQQYDIQQRVETEQDITQ